MDLMSVQTGTKRDKDNHICIERFFIKILGFSVDDLLEHGETILENDDNTYNIMLGQMTVHAINKNFQVLLKYSRENMMFKPDLFKDGYEQLEEFYKEGAEGLLLVSREIFDNDTLSDIFKDASTLFHRFTREELQNEGEYIK